MKKTEKQILDRTKNPILFSEKVQVVKVEQLKSPCVHRKPISARRELLDLRKTKTAAEALAGLDHKTEIFGFTKGQFSLLDLFKAVLEITGPAAMVVSTWTAAHHEIEALAELVAGGQIKTARWLVDFSFARRDPSAANHIRKVFGVDAVRVAQNHAKFATFENKKWRLVLRTSMNLNMNPRFEDFTIAHDPPMAKFIGRIINEIWKRQRRSLINAKPKDFAKFFNKKM